MNAIKEIREALGETQAAFAKGIKVSQGSVSFYENGTVSPPAVVALRMMEHAREYGYALTMDHIYGLKPMPKRRNIK